MAYKFKVGNQDVVVGGLQTRGDTRLLLPFAVAFVGLLFTEAFVILVGMLVVGGKGVPNFHLILGFITAGLAVFALIAVKAWLTYLRSSEGDSSSMWRYRNFRTNVYVGLGIYGLFFLLFCLPAIMMFASSYGRSHAAPGVVGEAIKPAADNKEAVSQTQTGRSTN